MKKICIVLVLFCAFFKMFAEDDDKLKLAVMEFEDRSRTLSKQLLADATEYLRGALISANKYIVIAQERQDQTIIKNMKKKSYRECNDKNCQIQLGQALSADTILRTTITRLGKTFVITSELIDLAKEATVVGAREKYDGTENSMSEALDKIAEKVIAAYESIQNEENSRSEKNKKEDRKYSKSDSSLKNYKNNEYSTSNQNDKMSIPEIQENLEFNRKIKIAGYSMLGAGAGIFIIGGVLFGVGAREKEPGEGAADMNLVESGFAMFGIGSCLIITGTIMAPIGAIREKKARIELNNLSVAPTKGGAYASLGFSF